jgi:uncharacterized membrane protein
MSSPTKFELWIAKNPTFSWSIILLVSGVISPHISVGVCLLIGVLTWLIDGYITSILTNQKQKAVEPPKS